MAQLQVYDLYKLSLDFINVEERGQVQIDRWNRSANVASIDFVNYLTGRLDEPPQQALSLLKTQKISDMLFPIFKMEMYKFSDGLLPYPPKYDYFLDLRISGDGSWKPGNCNDIPKYTIDEILNGRHGFRQVDIISHDEIPSRVNTRIPLLKKRPVGEQFDNGFLLYNMPSNNSSAFLAYVEEPNKIILNMAEDPNTKMITYQPVGSVHPPFHNKVGPYLARKIAQYYFQFTREESAIAISDVVSKTK